MLTAPSSDVASLKKGIIKNKEKARHTVFLIGETGVGKSLALKLFANVLVGNGPDHYDFDILGHKQTNSANLYEFTSNNGTVVGPDAFQYAEMFDPVASFASSTHLAWPTPAVFSNTSSTRGALPIRSNITSIPSLLFLSSLMAPSRTSLSAPTMHYPPCPLSSPNPWPAIPPSCSRMSRAPKIGASPGMLSQMFSKTLLSSSSTTPSHCRRSIWSSKMAQI